MDSGMQFRHGRSNISGEFPKFSEYLYINMYDFYHVYIINIIWSCLKYIYSLYDSLYKECHAIHQ